MIKLAATSNKKGVIQFFADVLFDDPHAEIIGLTAEPAKFAIKRRDDLYTSDVGKELLTVSCDEARQFAKQILELTDKE